MIGRTVARGAGLVKRATTMASRTTAPPTTKDATTAD